MKCVGRETCLKRVERSVSPKWGETLQVLGSGVVRIPLGEGFLSVTVLVVKQSELPIIIGTAFLRKHNANIDMQAKGCVMTLHGIPVAVTTLPSGHLRLDLGRNEQSCPVFYTEQELLNVHKRFGHAHHHKLKDLLIRAGEPMTSDEYKVMKRLTEKCPTCQWYRGKTSSYKVAANYECHFNHSVSADFLFLAKADEPPRKVLHLVCNGTKFNGAMFVEGTETSQDIFNAIYRLWISVFGAPVRLRVDQESIMVSQDLKRLLEGEICALDPVPVEGHWTLGVVERHHEPLRKIYRRLAQDRSLLSDEDILAIAVRCMNVTTGPEGLIPSLLVFGAIPRVQLRPELALHDEGGLQEERLASMLLARQEYERFVSVHKLKLMRNSQTPEFPAEDEIRPGTAVLVRREQSYDWTGPYVCAEVDPPNVHVFIPSGLRGRARKAAYHVNNVKVFNSSLDSATHLILYTDRSVPRDYQLWEKADEAELQGIVSRGCLKMMDKVPEGAMILGSRMERVVKQNGKRKSRFIVQGHKDPGKESQIVEAPVLSKYMLMFLLSLSTLLGHKLRYRDYSQAYLQSAFNLKRDIYIRLGKDIRDALQGLTGLAWPPIVKLIKPLYGLTESGAYWFSTLSRALDVSGFRVSALDSCARYFGAEGAVGVVVDDVLFFGNQDVLAAEARTASQFDNNGVVLPPFVFNGYEIGQTKEGLEVSRNNYVRTLIPKTSSFEEFQALRGQILYAVSSTRPDVQFRIAVLCQVTSDTWSRTESRRLANLCKFVQKSQYSLVYRSLQVETLCLRVYADASYSDEGASHLGYAIFLGDASDRVHFLHSSSVRAKQVTHSPLSAELLALCLAYDMAEALQTEYKSLGLKVPIILATDSKSLFDSVARKTTLREKRLMVRILLLRQGLEDMKISQLVHVPGKLNVSDGLTKHIPDDQLWRQVMCTGTLPHVYTNRVFLML